MVSNGTWRDYSFSRSKLDVSFNIYQRTSDRPILKILKNFKPKNKNEKFQVKDKNGMTLEKSRRAQKHNWKNKQRYRKILKLSSLTK